MNTIHAAVLGVVEGLTEFLPVSSTGHMILAGRVMRLPDTEFLKTFEIAIQLGAIAAVVAVYWRRLICDWEMMKRIAAAFVPTAVIGLIVYKGVKSMLGDADVVAWSLFIGGILILLFERAYSETCGFEGCGPCRVITRRLRRFGLWLRRKPPIDDPASMTYRQAMGIGLCQALAMIPGVSRSGATVIGGLTLGLSRSAIVQFSFLLAVPTMLAATAYDLMKSAPQFSGQDYGNLAVGFVVSFVVAWLVVKWFLRYVQSNDFRIFGYYRIVAAVVYFLIIR